MELPSFLHARDPSIIAYNIPRLNPNIITNLCEEFEAESNLSEDTKIEQLEVYLRLKPTKTAFSEVYTVVSNNRLICRVPTGSQFMRNVQHGKKLNFTFSKIYGTETKQSEIFNDCVKEKVLNFINGNNCSIFTYGTSGSGKTYTILGTAENPGIIPRSLEYMFRTLPQIQKTPAMKPIGIFEVSVLDSEARCQEISSRKNLLNDTNIYSDKDKTIHIKTYRAMQNRLSTEPTATIDNFDNIQCNIWVSFAEVYNEYIYDLLKPETRKGRFRQKLRLAQDSKGNIFVKNLTTICVSSGLEAYEILQYGMHNLNYASTTINDHSSRSHCIFTIKLVQSHANSDQVRISHFNFCDLAGSERLKHTKNVGDRLKESNNINTSLHVLGRCIKAIRESQKNDSKILPPFRESKLTQIFRSALSGQESLAMLVNINPSVDMFDESQHVLNFSAIAKEIQMEIEKPLKLHVEKRFSQYVHSRSNVLSTISETRRDSDAIDDQIQYFLEQRLVARETEIRAELVETFRKAHDEAEKNYRRDMKSLEERLKKKYETKLEEQKHFYESTMMMARKRQKLDATVIEIDSDENEEDSDNDDDDAVKRELRLLTEKYQSLKSEYNRTRSDLSELQAENTQLKFDKQENTSLLEHATLEYQEMCKELEEKQCEIFRLQKEIEDLNYQLTVYAEEKIEDTEYVEELEDKLNNTMDDL